MPLSIRVRRLFVAVGLVSAVTFHDVQAQAVAPSADDSTISRDGDVAHRTFFTRGDLTAVGVGLVGTGIASLFDERAARWTRRPAVQGGE